MKSQDPTACSKMDEEDFSLFFDLSTDLISVVDPDGYFKKINPAFISLLGYSEVELQLQLFQNFVHPEDQAHTLKAFQDLKSGITPVCFENRFIKKDGGYCWLSWSISLVVEKGHLYSIGRDITDRADCRRMEKAFRQVNQRYNLLSKATSTAVWEWDLIDNRSFIHGDDFMIIFGYDVINNYLPVDFWKNSIIHPEDRETVIRELEIAIHKNADFWHSEYRFKKADGSYAFVKENACIIKKDGKPSRMIGCVEDITIQKKAELALFESQKNYKKLFNNAPLPQFIYDLNTFRFLEVNEAAINHYGYSRKEIFQMKTLDIRAKDEISRLLQYIGYLKSSEESMKAVWTHYKKNGQPIIVETSASLIEYQGHAAVMATMNDITEKIRLEEKITELKVSEQKKITKAQINAQEKEREEIGRELHDNINQQLTTAKLYLDLARSNEEMRLDLIKKSESILNSCINGIRSLSRELVSPTLHADGLMEALNELIASYNVAGNFRIESSWTFDPEKIDAELSVALFRITQEQLVNITKYAGAKETCIALDMNEDAITLNISDDGIGCNPNKIKPGLGLSNIKNRCELYNGIMHLDSAPGKGCKLMIQIPIENCHGIKHILIAEDDEDDQQLIAQAFAEVASQHRITFTPNGKELMEMLKVIADDQLPSLIVLDLNMPVMDGLETLKQLQLQNRFRNIPKIIYSTASNASYKKLCLSENATAYLEKKSSFTEMKESIKQMLTFCR
jgi:PAS domain S-box-containing protein